MRIRNRQSAIRNSPGAFTLLEVMIAGALFFMAVFAILGLVATTLRNARALQQTEPDAGMLAADLAVCDKLTEGEDSGDFGDLYPGYRWTTNVYLAPIAPTNGLFQADITISRQIGNKSVDTQMSILLFRPDSPRR